MCEGVPLSQPSDPGTCPGGFDDPGVLQHLEVSLTTVIQHTEMISYRAVRLLVEEIQNLEKYGRDYIRSYTQCYYPVRLVEAAVVPQAGLMEMEVQHGQNGKSALGNAAHCLAVRFPKGRRRGYSFVDDIAGFEAVVDYRTYLESYLAQGLPKPPSYRPW